jgi:hypothetical protein
MYVKSLKPSKNKKGHRISRCTISVSFFTAGSWEKDPENGGPGKFFGPSYFEKALKDTLK